MRRWLWLAAGLLLVALAAVFLLRGDAAVPAGERIDEASRAQLERLLEEAEEAPAP